MRDDIDKKAPLAAFVSRENGPLIKAVFDLYDLHGKRVLDPTFGRGKWWTSGRGKNRVDFSPPRFTANDRSLDPTFDFQAMPYADASFDVVAFDPPYIPQGGRDTSTQSEFLDRFGLVDVPETAEKLRALINNGMREAWRVLDRDGLLLLKCMNYVTGGKHRPQQKWAIDDALELGFLLETQFVHVSGTGPQPKKNLDGTVRAVLSPRANYSVLLVLRRPRSAPLGARLFEGAA